MGSTSTNKVKCYMIRDGLRGELRVNECICIDLKHKQVVVKCLKLPWTLPSIQPPMHYVMFMCSELES